MQIKVAVFEDNTALRQSLQQLIDSRPNMVCTGLYANASQGLKILGDDLPDVVLMDINMPGISGIEAVQIIKTSFPQLPVLMQTVFEDDDKIFAALCAGAAGYMLKKSSPQKMIEAIEETFQGGAPMTPSIASRVLQMFRLQSTSPSNEFIDLSEREKEILAWLVKGKSYNSVAEACYISIDTVKTHVKHIYEKMHVHSKTEAVAKAIRNKLV